MPPRFVHTTVHYGDRRPLKPCGEAGAERAENSLRCQRPLLSVGKPLDGEQVQRDRTERDAEGGVHGRPLGILGSSEEHQNEDDPDVECTEKIQDRLLEPGEEQREPDEEADPHGE